MGTSAEGELDFEEECRTSFLFHTAERLKINPLEPGHRHLNAARRSILLDQIDTVLDTYLEWCEIQDGPSRPSA